MCYGEAILLMTGELEPEHPFLRGAEHLQLPATEMFANHFKSLGSYP